MILKNATIGLLIILLTHCSVSVPKGFISTDGTQFIDPAGRTLIFNGVNVICKDPRKNYTEQFSRAEFDNLAGWGCTVIRLGVIWSGVEPYPGVYDEKYLKELDQLVNWATEAGLYVMLDMHQDLYGQKFSDGAPDWATIDGGLPHNKGAIWSDSYLISPAVQTAFDSFWSNVQATDEVGIQDHYINMWQMLAEKYAGNSMILGFDIMNEPFMGTAAQNIMPLMIQAYAHKFLDLETAFQQGNIEEKVQDLANQWSDEAGRIELLKTLENPDNYAQVIESAAPICISFEEGPLSAFYQRARDAIREVNTKHIIFLEHNYFANTGIAARFKLPVDEEGSPDPLLAYAAHGYDLVTDTKSVGDPSHARVQFIFDRIHESSKRMNIPLLVGEWGAYGGDHPVYLETAAAVMALFEQYHCSQTYWAYPGPVFPEKSYFPVLNRTYPVAVAGQLRSYVGNHDKSFFIEWETTGLEKHPTVIFLPDMAGFKPEHLNLNPQAKYRLEALPMGKGGYLHILPDRLAGIRKMQYY